jgi:phage terminase small subunit
MTKPLTPKQAAFCREYIQDCNATQAAIRAGYSARTARQQAADLLTKPNIAEHLNSLRKPLESEAIATYERACARMTEIMDSGSDGDAIRACDRLAKLRGWDQPTRVQTEDTTPPTYDLRALSDDELAAFETLLAKASPK